MGRGRRARSRRDSNRRRANSAPGPITGIKADSRDVGAGDLFVALNTGVAYVDEAAARGAATLVPDDQEAALAALAALVRSKSDARVVAVVGSTGKTSTKDILGALCSAACPDRSGRTRARTTRSGCRSPSAGSSPRRRCSSRRWGCEGSARSRRSARSPGPTSRSSRSIGPEHLELVGTVERVAEANAEAIAALPPGGVAVVPADAPELEPYLSRDDIEIRRFDRAAVEGSGNVWRFPLAAAASSP